MSDPRVEAAAVAYYVTDGWSQDDSATPDAGWTGLEEYARADYRALTGIILAAADAADRARGVVRVDTRDEALGRRIKGVAQWWVNGRLPVAPQFWDGFGGAVLAALAPEAKS